MHAISRRLALLALGTLALFGTAACGGDDDDPTGPGGTATGTYTLRTVNGQNVPTTVYEGDDLGFYYKVEVLSGHVTLDADGTFEDVTTIRETEGTGTPTPSEFVTVGTYTRTGNTLTFTDDDTGEDYTITVQSDGSLVQSGDFGGFPLTARYVRQ